jgi:hypothetical protein
MKDNFSSRLYKFDGNIFYLPVFGVTQQHSWGTDRVETIVSLCNNARLPSECHITETIVYYTQQCFLKANKTSWEKVISYFDSVRREPARKHETKNNSAIITYIRWNWEVSADPLPNNDMVIHMLIHRRMGEIYKVRRWDELTCYDT